jgi:hypothetical protein
MAVAVIRSAPRQPLRAAGATEAYETGRRRHTVLLSILDDFRPFGAESLSVCTLQQFREIVEAAARIYHGIILGKCPAGSVLTLFANPADAVRAALHIRRRAQTKTVSDLQQTAPIRLAISGRSTPSDDIDGIRSAHHENLSAAAHMGASGQPGDILIAERLVRYGSVREALAGQTIVRRRVPSGENDSHEVYVLPGNTQGKPRKSS